MATTFFVDMGIKHAFSFNTSLSPGCSFDNAHLHQINGVGGLWALKTTAVGSGVAEQKFLAVHPTNGTLVSAGKTSGKHRIYVYVGSLPDGTGEEDFCALQSGSNRILDVRALPNGALAIYGHSGAQIGTAPAGTIVTGSYLRIDLNLSGVGGSSGVWEVKVEHVSVANGSGLNLTATAIDSISCGKKTNRNNGGLTAWWTDILGDDTTEPPDGVIVTKRPLADGARSGNSGWTAVGNPSKAVCIADVPYAAGLRLTETLATKVYTATVTTNSALGITGTPNKCKVALVGYGGTAGGLKVIAHVNGSDVENGTGYAGGATEAFVQKYLDVSPDGGGSAWTLAKLDQVEIGGDLATAPSSGNAAILDAYFSVDFNPVAAPTTPTITSPTTGSNRAAGTITLAHSVPGTADRFRARVDGGAWTDFVDTAGTHDISISQGLGTKADHVIELQAGLGSVFSASASITLHIYGLPAPPSDISRGPSSGAHRDEDVAVVFTWENQSAAQVPADKYELVVTPSGGSDQVHTDLASPTFTDSDGFSTATYTWKVRTHNAVSGWGPFSPTFTLIVDDVQTVGDVSVAFLINEIKKAILVTGGGPLDVDAQGRIQVRGLNPNVINPAAIQPGTFSSKAENAAETKAALTSTPNRIAPAADGSVPATVTDRTGFGIDAASKDAIVSGIIAAQGPVAVSSLEVDVLNTIRTHLHGSNVPLTVDARGQAPQSYPIAVVSNGVSPSVFNTNRTEPDGTFKGGVRVRTGVYAGAYRKIVQYRQAGGQFTVDPFPATLANDVELDLVNA